MRNFDVVLAFAQVERQRDLDHEAWLTENVRLRDRGEPKPLVAGFENSDLSPSCMVEVD